MLLSSSSPEILSLDGTRSLYLYIYKAIAVYIYLHISPGDFDDQLDMVIPDLE